MAPRSQSDKYRWLALALLASSAALAQAGGDVQSRRGEQTAAWLELQKQQEPDAEEKISGERAALIWERHVESFGREHPDVSRDDGESISSD